MQSSTVLVKNTAWAFVSQIAYILVGLTGNVILARILTPSEFGTVGIAMFFIGISNVLVDSGMGGALIRKEKPSNIDYSTIFVFNLFISIVLFLLCLIISGYVAEFYNTPILRYVLSALSLTIVINSLSLVQGVKLVKAMSFKKIGLYRLVAFFMASTVAITMAYMNFGLWSIVALQVLSALFLTIIYRIKEGGMGKIVFSMVSFKEMLSFGVFTTLSSLMITVFDNIYQLIIGRYFSVINAGYYYQSKRLQDVLDAPTKNVLYNVVYSYMSRLQSENAVFKLSHANIIKLLAIALSTITSLVIMYSDQIILILFGQKWIHSSFYLKLLSISSFFSIMEIVYGNLFRIFNKTHSLLYLEITKKIIQSLSIMIGIYFHSIDYLLYGLIFTSIVGYLITLIASQKIIKTDQNKNHMIFLKIIIICTVSTLITTLTLNSLSVENYYRIPFVILFLIINFFLLYIFKIENVISLMKNVKTFRNELP
ncbi:lipopolysaccharide biosynthesis protein [Flavobacterium sp. KS-LB2]|uniref:lipopolysaccharide biosynthesis protein n=1 Tax=Flavobacterium sp. KS-LB2 TaxID=3120525 RepID=UPI0030CE09C1